MHVHEPVTVRNGIHGLDAACLLPLYLHSTSLPVVVRNGIHGLEIACFSGSQPVLERLALYAKENKIAKKNR